MLLRELIEPAFLEVFLRACNYYFFLLAWRHVSIDRFFCLGAIFSFPSPRFLRDARTAALILAIIVQLFQLLKIA